MADSEDELKFDSSGIGRWADEYRFEVTGERIAEYAKATNDPIERHLAGEIASPVFAIVPVFQALIEPAVEVAPLELIPRLVHGEQDFRFHRPIKPGDKLVSRGKTIGYEGLPNGTRGAVYLECRTEDGELVNEQYVTFFFRKFDAGETVGELAPGHKFDESLRSASSVAKVVQHVDEDQTFRYGPAAGDPMPIHLDEETAKMAGLPGIIAHGLCTMAFTSWAVLTELADGRTERLKRLAVRFAKPVLPGQDITTQIWRAGRSDGESTYAYETTAGDAVVVKDGLAVIAD
ncbi:MaoC/PaaZ C-terminal domain-containing protein [Amycolatopsis nigrescens]|uniref:MaoC/PaaZ C-terminal domain-containing protein n=1 Tax=Amycolatopsis nigrescens TaxID=381445 RepID=UPI000367EF6B|nr:MaoC/PaaZ C-terminal domain-containing protein [Amycolatopsis nigrescens]